MKKTYIIPQLFEIRIDSEIALRLTSPASTTVREPGDGSAGAGGESNNSGESGWERTDGGNGAKLNTLNGLNDFENAMWQ